jgi:hypothetical protein
MRAFPSLSRIWHFANRFRLTPYKVDLLLGTIAAFQPGLVSPPPPAGIKPALIFGAKAIPRCPSLTYWIAFAGEKSRNPFHLHAQAKFSRRPGLPENWIK